MIRVAILGATGYTALELMKILLRHPEVEIAALTTRQEGNPHVSTVHPQLTGRLDLCLENAEPASIAERVDCVFCCLPHAASASSIMQLLNHDVKVIDFSADYRLRDPETYDQWYGGPHPDPDRLGNVVYGLPEIFADEIPGAQLIANPGCYSSTSILGLAPLVTAGLINPETIIVDAKSGVSGAGRSPKLGTLYPECNESLSAYSVGAHRHEPEINQILSHVSRQNVQVLFTPHLVPMDRGILCTIYADLAKSANVEDLLGEMRRYYEGKPFVRVVDHLPATKHVSGTNYCDMTVRVVGGRAIILSCTDNLIKGASGVAVQNFNLMHGIDETTGF